jgi:hypothetical protein
MQKTEYLLNQVNGLLKSYEKLAKSTGENFNIFSVMGMERDEVKTHSRIIGELLNPLGSHSQGDTFLKLFVNQINKKFKIELDDFGSLVNYNICERFIGNIDLLNASGGRIDITIEDKNQILIIENKPGIGHQPFQLIRYYQYAKNKNKKFHILYLTMDGRDMQNEIHSVNNIKIKGFNISFKNKVQYDEFEMKNTNEHYCLFYPISFGIDVKDWIEKCIEKSVSLPLIRETLIQYLNLIKKLTHQTMNNELKTEIKNLIKNNFSESSEIKNNYENARKEVISVFWKELETLVQSYLTNLDKSWKVKIDDANLISRFTHILLYKEGNENAYFYCRYNKNDGEIHYGIILNKKFIKIKATDILKKIAPNSNLKSGPQSIMWQKEKDENYNFSNSSFLTSIYKKQDLTLVSSFKDNIIEFTETNEQLYIATLKYLEDPNLILYKNVSEKEIFENHSDSLSN